MSLWERTWQPLPLLCSPMFWITTPPSESSHSVQTFINIKVISLKRFFLIYILFCHRGAPLISDNILSMGLRCWQETNSQGWQKLGMCCKEVVSHTPPENPPHPFPLHSPIPIPSEGCFCWIIDAKVLLIRKKETSNHLTEKKAGWEGVCRWIKCLENAAKGRINQSPPPISVLTFSVFLLYNPSSIILPCVCCCVYAQICVSTRGPSRPRKISGNEHKVRNPNISLAQIILR